MQSKVELERLRSDLTSQLSRIEAELKNFDEIAWYENKLKEVRLLCESDPEAANSVEAATLREYFNAKTDRTRVENIILEMLNLQYLRI